MKNRKFTIALEYEADGRVSAHCIELPGCHSWGENKEDALKNIKEAIEGYLEVLEEMTKDYDLLERVEVFV